MITRNRAGVGFDNAPYACLLFVRSVSGHGKPRSDFILYFILLGLLGMDPSTSVRLPSTKV